MSNVHSRPHADSVSIRGARELHIRNMEARQRRIDAEDVFLKCLFPLGLHLKKEPNGLCVCKAEYAVVITTL